MRIDAKTLLGQEYLETRAKLLELAAAFDRLDRADGEVADDDRLHLLRSAVEELASDAPGRAERLQVLFSLPYDREWRERLDVRPRGA